MISANTSAVLTLLIVMTKRWHGHLSNDTSDGPQKFHIALTPRVGGIAIFIGLIVGWMFAPPSLSQLLGPILIAGLPVFVTGVIEDISKTVSPSKRLMAAFVTSTAAWILTGYAITHIEISWLNFLFAYLPLSILFTAFAVAGVTNAVNIIDGFNGLAGGTLMICTGLHCLACGLPQYCPALYDNFFCIERLYDVQLSVRKNIYGRWGSLSAWVSSLLGLGDNLSWKLPGLDVGSTADMLLSG